jgi:hypothetical protein
MDSNISYNVRFGACQFWGLYSKEHIKLARFGPQLAPSGIYLYIHRVYTVFEKVTYGSGQP